MSLMLTLLRKGYILQVQGIILAKITGQVGYSHP